MNVGRGRDAPFIWGTKADAQPSVAPRTRAVFILRGMEGGSATAVVVGVWFQG